MDLRRDDLDWAATEGLVTQDQAARLWTALQDRANARGSTTAKFDGVHVAYYLGAMIVIGAMGFFMTLGWEAFGGGGIFAIATAYTLVFVFVGRALWRMPGLKIPGGLLITMAVSLTPLAMYGLERLLGIWPTSDPGTYRDYHTWVNSGWLWMELETVLAGCIALRFVRFPFLTAPIAFTLWYLSMDLAPLLFGRFISSDDRALVSAAVGLIMICVGYLIDRRTREDFAFWMYLFGMFAFWGALSTLDSGSEVARFFYLLLNVGLIVTSVLLERRVFLVFGSLGVFGYLGYESWHTFQDSIAFPFALSGIGLLILFLGVKYARNRAQIDSRLNALVPAWLEQRLPRARVRR
jgi:hypothetical protein